MIYLFDNVPLVMKDCGPGISALWPDFSGVSGMSGALGRETWVEEYRFQVGAEWRAVVQAEAAAAPSSSSSVIVVGEVGALSPADVDALAQSAAARGVTDWTFNGARL